LEKIISLGEKKALDGAAVRAAGGREDAFSHILKLSGRKGEK